MTKKEYAKPVLRTYGSVKALTRGVGGSNGDTGQNNTTKRGGG